jgi:ribonuclease BN (tRNA processing enzyme)
VNVKVTVIGCSPAWPNAGGAQSGYLVEGRGRLLLDCGPGVLARLRNSNGSWPALDAIAITHFHLDHWGDLVPWTFGAAFGPGRSVPKPELWLPPGGEERLRSFGGPLAFTSMLSQAFEVREYGDAVFTAAGFEVTPVRLAHYDQLTFGLRVSDGTSVLAYSGDTAPTPALGDLARDADLFLCEATLDDPEPAERGHLTADEAKDAFESSRARRLVVIHRPDELPLDPSIERAYDGLELEL